MKLFIIALLLLTLNNGYAQSVISNKKIIQGVRLFDPTNVSGLVARWRANKNYNSSGTATWTDEINGYVLTAVTANPTQITGRNNVPALKFTTGYMKRSGQIASLEGKSGLTIIMLSSGVNMTAESWVPSAAVSYHDLSNDGTKMTALIGFGDGSNDNKIRGLVRNSENSYNDALSLGGYWSVKTLLFDGSQAGNQNRGLIYENSDKIYYQSTGTIPSTTWSSGTTPELSVAAYPVSGSYTNQNGSIAEILIYNRALTSTEIRNIQFNYFMKLMHMNNTNLLICVGDSQTYGTGGTTNGSWPADMLSYFGESNYTIYNVGQPSVRLTTLNGKILQQISPRLNTADFKNAVVCLWAGTNDNYDGTAASTIYNNTIDYATSIHDNGGKLLVVDMLSRSDGGAAGYNTRRATYNSSVTGSTSFDAVADIASDSNIGGNGAETNLTYFANDLVHLNNTGEAIVAGYVEPQIATAIATTLPSPSGILENAVWTNLTNATVVSNTITSTAANGGGVGTKRIKPRTTGYVQATYTGTSNATAVLGLDKTGTSYEAYSSFDFGLYVFSGTYFYVENNGSGTSLSTSAAVNDLYRLNVDTDGSSFINVLYQKSSNGGSSWTTMRTSSSTFVSHYLKASIVTNGNNLNNVQIYNGTTN